MANKIIIPVIPKGLIEQANSIDIAELRYQFKSNSSYFNIWLRLKYELVFTLDIPLVKGNEHRIIGRALSRLKIEDKAFKLFCLKTYQTDLCLSCKTINSKLVRIALYHPAKGVQSLSLL
jgi:hypothetical protein